MADYQTELSFPQIKTFNNVCSRIGTEQSCYMALLRDTVLFYKNAHLHKEKHGWTEVKI